MRIAAVGDLHVKSQSARLTRGLARLAGEADVLLLGGDLTDHGLESEARALADALAPVGIPVLAVLGNHDYESGAPDTVRRILGDAGVRVLDGGECVIGGVGFAGVKGFGGGFGAHALSPWGEPAIKAFADEAMREADALRAALARLDTRQRVALLHYAPVRATLVGEPPEIHPYLGSSRLGDALEAGGATLAFHGHAHSGSVQGATVSGIPVLNVAAPLLGATAADRIPARVVALDPARARAVGILDRVPESSAEGALYRAVMQALRAAKLPFLIGGGAAVERFTGIARELHDLDLLIDPRDVHRALRALRERGFDAEISASHWLAKVYGSNGSFLDLIFGSGNGACPVDPLWFEHAVPGVLLDEPVSICPVEELLWTKCFVMERERYDGADVMHLLHARAESLDWERLQWRFGTHWRVLLSHLVTFGFVYPGERGRIPAALLGTLIERLAGELGTDDPARLRICRGGFLSRAQYLVDFERGYEDAREAPRGPLEREEIDDWTRAIGSES